MRLETLQAFDYGKDKMATNKNDKGLKAEVSWLGYLPRLPRLFKILTFSTQSLGTVIDKRPNILIKKRK